MTWLIYFHKKIPALKEYYVGLDQTPHSAESDPDLHRFNVTLGIYVLTEQPTHISEPPHDKINKMTFVSSKDSD